MSAKLTDLSAVTKVDDDDLLYVVDTGDTADHASGSSRKATAKNARRRTAPITLDAAAADSGNSPTTTLRAKLCLARVASSGKYVPYAGDGTDSVDVPVGFLVAATPVSGDTPADIYVGGEFEISECPGLDLMARKILRRRGFQFREDATPDIVAASGIGRFSGVVRKGGNYTLTAADDGKLVIATGACVFTLPTKANGLEFDFLQTTNSDLTIQDGSSSIIARNNAVASSVAYSTSSQKIGARCRVECVYVDTATLAWVFTGLCNHTVTVS